MDWRAVVAGAFGGGSQPSRKTPPGAPMSSGAGGLMDFRKWDMDKALREGYQINEWVHACVNVLARHAASVPWRVSAFESPEAKSMHVRERKSIPATELAFFIKDEHRLKRRFVEYKGLQPIYEKKVHLRQLPDDPLEQLLEDPNPKDTRQDLMETLIQHLHLGGNGMLVKIRGRVDGLRGYKTPLELWTLFPQSTRVEADGQVVKRYIYQPNGVGGEGEREYLPEDVMHLKFVDPGNPVWGISPLMAAARSVDTDVQAARFQLTSMANRGVADYALVYDKDIDDQAYKRARRMMAENRTGPENARAPWIVGNAAKIERMSLTAAEIDYIKTRGFNRQAICSIFNVWPQVIAVSEGFSIANGDWVLKNHWTSTMIPLLEKVMAVVNKSLVADFSQDRYAWFDPSNVEALNENVMDRYRMSKIVHTMGTPLTELNDRFDLGLMLDDVVGADVGFFPAGVVPAHIAIEGGATNQPGNTNTPPEGGDPGEPGDEQAPNENPVEDMPNDGSVEDPAEAANREIADLEWRYFDNGHADPHGGIKRWTPEEIRALILRVLGSRLDMDSVDDWYVAVLPIREWEARQVIDALPDRDAVGFDFEVVGDEYLLRFYHGQETEAKRERLLARVRSWG